jgi:hypothetical protein
MYGWSDVIIESIRDDDARTRVSTPERRSAVAGVALRRVGLRAPLRGWAREEARRGASRAFEPAAIVVVGVSGASACPLLRPCASCFDLDVRGCGFAGTAVCVELLDADELEGVGEDGREGVGVTAEESVCELVLNDRRGTGSMAEVGSGIVGSDGAAGAGTSLMSEVRCCSCKDTSDVARR